MDRCPCTAPMSVRMLLAALYAPVDADTLPRPVYLQRGFVPTPSQNSETRPLVFSRPRSYPPSFKKVPNRGARTRAPYKWVANSPTPVEQFNTNNETGARCESDTRKSASLCRADGHMRAALGSRR